MYSEFSKLNFHKEVSSHWSDDGFEEDEDTDEEQEAEAEEHTRNREIDSLLQK